MPEKKLLILIRSSPYATLNGYEGLRMAAGLVEHRLKVVYMGEAVPAATREADHTLTAPFLADLPDLGAELYAEVEALEAHGLKPESLHAAFNPASRKDITEMIAWADHTFTF